MPHLHDLCWIRPSILMTFWAPKNVWIFLFRIRDVTLKKEINADFLTNLKARSELWNSHCSSPSSFDSFNFSSPPTTRFTDESFRTHVIFLSSFIYQKNSFGFSLIPLTCAFYNTALNFLRQKSPSCGKASKQLWGEERWNNFRQQSVLIKGPNR